MKVLHVVATGTRRGGEVFACDLVRALNPLGLSQRVAVIHGSPTADVRFEAPTRSLGSADGDGVKARLDLVAMQSLRRAVARWRPDVIQAHGGEPLKYAVPATIGLGIPVIYRRIGSAHPSVSSGLRRLVYARLMRGAARLVAVAETVRRETIQVFGVLPERVVTIPNAVDHRRTTATRGREATRVSLGVSEDAPLLLALGAFTWEKDPLAQVEVAARVLDARPESTYLMLGEGLMRRDVEDMIHRRGLDGRVLLLGNRPDVADLLAACDLLVLTSRTEGMPAALIEAGMAGVPVVAYSIGGIPEVVVDGSTGLLAPAGDLDGLSDAVLRLVEDEEARRAMGRAARERCLSRFDIRTIAPRYVELYEELMKAW